MWLYQLKQKKRSRFCSPARRFMSHAMAKMMDATVPMIIMIATTKLKILSPLLMESLPFQDNPTVA